MSKKARIALSTGVVKNSPGHERVLFEVPIYRCSKDKFSDEMAKEKGEPLGPLNRLREEAPRSYATAERRFEETESYSWLYNEAIGWIQLSVHGREIKGEVYFVTAKRIKRGMRKRFHWAGDLFQFDVFPNDTSTRIYNAICAELDMFRSERAYRKRYVDTEAFRHIGPFVDWCRLVRFNEDGGDQKICSSSTTNEKARRSGGLKSK
jgi:hypothetical protein